MHALTIPGFISQRQLVQISKWVEPAPDQALVVEIGSYLGRSASALLDAANIRLICIDDFRLPLKADAWTRNQLAPTYPEGTANTPDILAHNLAQYSERVEIIAGKSPECFTRPDQVWGVFVDEDHFNPSVHDNITFWWDRIVPGGVMFGHDFEELDYRGIPMDVIPEVMGFADIHNLYVEVSCNMWLLQKPH